MQHVERSGRTGGQRWYWLVGTTLVAAVALHALAPPSARAAGFLSRVLRVLGLTVAPGELREDVEAVTGRLYIFDLATGEKRSLTSNAGWTSPLFEPKGKATFALKAGKVWNVPVSGGAARDPVLAPGVVKLVALDPDQPGELLVLVKGAAPLGMLSLATGKLQMFSVPKGTREKNVVAYTRGEDRLTGKVHVLVKTETRVEAEGKVSRQTISVQDTRTGKSVVVRCGDANCRQPALSPDDHFLAYVEAD